MIESSLYEVFFIEPELLGFRLAEFVQWRNYSRCLLCQFPHFRFVHAYLKMV